MSTATNDQPSILKWANDKTGEFKRQVSSFRDVISDEPGSKFVPEA
jgi:glutathionyl-hydroquinone reductase